MRIPAREEFVSFLFCMGILYAMIYGAWCVL